MKDLTVLFKEIKQVNEKLIQLQDSNGDPKEIEVLEQQLADLEIEVDECNSMEKKK